MKRIYALLLMVFIAVTAFGQSIPDIGSAAKAGAVTEAMNDTTKSAAGPEVKDGPVKKNNVTAISTAVVLIIIIAIAATASRRRKKLNSNG